MRIDVDDPKYRIQALGMDGQHQVLFRAINRMHDSIIDGCALETLGTLFKQLEEYAEIHFKSEEALMARAGYPRLAAHRREHRSFIARVNALQWYWQTGRRPPPTFQVMEFLQNWVTHHILTQDQDYDLWIAEHSRVEPTYSNIPNDR